MLPNQTMVPPSFPMTDLKPVMAAVVPQKFEVRIREIPMLDANGRPNGQSIYKNEEWVEVAKVGVTIPATTPHNIERLKKAAKKAMAQNDEKDNEFAALWRTIEPYYNNWKTGGDADLIINGTPLAAWSGITKDVVDGLKPFNIRSVEDLASVNDSIMARIPNPNMHLYRERARKFLSTKDIAVAVAELTNANAEVEALKAQLDEIKRMYATSEFSRRETQSELEDAVPAVARKRKAKAEAA